MGTLEKENIRETNPQSNKNLWLTNPSVFWQSVWYIKYWIFWQIENVLHRGCHKALSKCQPTSSCVPRVQIILGCFPLFTKKYNWLYNNKKLSKYRPMWWLCDVMTLNKSSSVYLDLMNLCLWLLWETLFVYITHGFGGHSVKMIPTPLTSKHTQARRKKTVHHLKDIISDSWCQTQILPMLILCF